MNFFHDPPSPAWEQWTHGRQDWQQRDRHSLIQTVTVHEPTLRLVDEDMPLPQIMGLTVNVSSSGLCLLAEWSPNPGDVVRLYLPLSTVAAKTPTLADVRWVRALPFADSRLSMVGLRFIL